MNKKKILIIGVIILMLFLAFSYLFNKKTDTTGLSVEIKTSESGDAKYIYSLLQKMSKVKLTDSIFSDPVFASLKDNTISLNPQEAGRNNPFAPVSLDTSITGIKSTTTINRSR